MHPLIQQLLEGGPVITDGAWGTELQSRGLGLGEFPDAWNLTHPERVAEVARTYVEAGSRVILTNTFGANRLRLGDHAAAGQVREINHPRTHSARRRFRRRLLRHPPRFHRGDCQDAADQKEPATVLKLKS
jgi:5-methyltetrahydrofolate--homocysteine methyltransferase